MRPDGSPGETPIAPAVLEQAADWLLRLQDAPDDAGVRDGCRRWCRADPEHARAWGRVERLRGLIGRVPPELALPVLDRAPDPRRRQAIKRLALLAAVAVPGLWGGREAWRSMRPGDIRTATGERRRVSLPDAGRLDLASHTAVSIDYDGHWRRLHLHRGEIAVETAHDTVQPARPFLVEVPQGTLEALGTRFDVRLDQDGLCRLAVLDGAVRVVPARDPAIGIVVTAGHALRFGPRGAGRATTTGGDEMAWRDGMLAADAMPLCELVSELARYRHGRLRCAPEVAALRVSGAFPLDDTDRSLAMIAASSPVRIRRHAGGWWTLVEARPDTASAHR